MVVTLCVHMYNNVKTMGTVISQNISRKEMKSFEMFRTDLTLPSVSKHLKPSCKELKS